jgi:4-phospho-D-threonate 3-dehydrogenase / 4-phospho-D-erythronate 3-dehydrogenase
MKNREKPILAITMGDPAGIGPEIALKAFAEKSVYDHCRPLLIGNIQVLEKMSGIIKSPLELHSVNDVSDANFKYGTVDVFHIDVEGGIDDIDFGKISAKAGDLAFRIVTRAIDLAMKNEVDGTVTGPIHKGAINSAGHTFSGHTEIYAHYTNTSKYAMLLAEENLRVIHVSTHVSLRQACDLVKKDRVLDCVRLMHSALAKIGIGNPRIGVAGLNPHSSDNGLFGDEEMKEIIPAVNAAKDEGFNVDGPIPPDTLFALAVGGQYDGCIAMYHDQGHIPFKVKGFVWDLKSGSMKTVKGVNITLGLPIIRTSVDHGTAFEIAGKGIASHQALLSAIDYAIKLHD